MKVALYVRVSTQDQTTETQELELKAYAKSRNWEIFRVYRDVTSGSLRKRKAFDDLLLDAKKSYFNAILVTRLDRWGRSLLHLYETLELLKELKIPLIITQQNLNTSDDSAITKAFLGMLGVFAAFERDILRERTKENLAMKKAKGIVLGKKRNKRYDKKILELRERKLTIRQIAEEVGVSHMKVQRTLKALRLHSIKIN